jgi:hypothetical protein
MSLDSFLLEESELMYYNSVVNSLLNISTIGTATSVPNANKGIFVCSAYSRERGSENTNARWLR